MPSTEQNLNKFIWRLRLENKIDFLTYKELRSSESITPKFYGLPKIHKIGIPFRPIVSFTGSPTYNLSKHLANICGPLVGQTGYTVKNSLDFCRKFSDVTISQNETQLSFDVVSLFTSIPVDLACSIALEKLTHDDTLADRTKLTLADIGEGLTICLNASFFSYKSIIYKQIFGTPMGSPLSLVLANLVMEHLELSN